MYAQTRQISHSLAANRPTVKWPEVLSLGALNISVAISWIAYLEFQPVLLEKFSLGSFSLLLVITKALVLVAVPVLIGWLSDRNLRNRHRYFTSYMIGISATAMIFMIVASIIQLGPESPIAVILPVMVVLWLIGMAVFIAPAYSMLTSFASRRNLPLAVGIVILLTDLVYALEPLVLSLIQFFGETLTFVVGGILIIGTGYLFYRLTTDEVYERVQSVANTKKSTTAYPSIILIASIIGIGRAFLVEYIPKNASFNFIDADSFAFLMLGLSAVIAFASARYVIRTGKENVLKSASFFMFLGIIILLLSSGNLMFFIGTAMLSVSFGLVNVSGIPTIFERISPMNITLGIGVFLGVSALAEGIFEIAYAL